MLDVSQGTPVAASDGVLFNLGDLGAWTLQGTGSQSPLT